MKQKDTYARYVDMEYDPSNLVFTKWIALKFYNHLDMDWYTKNALWIYWARGDDEVEYYDEESSDPDDENLIDEDGVAEIFRIETNVSDFETPTCRASKEFNYLLQIDPGVLNKDIDGFRTYKDYKDDWIYEYCNGENFPGAFKVRHALRYQYLEWYEALKDGKLKEEALLNKAIMDGTINEEEETLEETWRKWDEYTTHDHEEIDVYNEEEHNEGCNLFNNTAHNAPI
uniref:VIER F-box protein 2 n=1 Tax=Tanacetum cinerariifolium TaxID=118510 RepID=A0A699KZR5_TANCI|nr:VIER F-box protein 2 [Tanacetum cinerariifolium]